MRVDGHEWLEREKRDCLLWGQAWTKNWDRPWGGLVIPREGLILHSTLVLPLRTGLSGPHPYLRATPPNIIVSDSFPEGAPVIAWEDSRSQGAFSQFLENVSIDCREIANGPELAGDQESFYRGVAVDSPRDWGLWAKTLSHGACLDRISVEGKKGDATITGLRIGGAGKPSTACLIQGSSFNWCGVGIERIDCAVVDDVATSFEHAVVPYVTTKSTNCRSRCHLMLSGGSDGTLAKINQSRGVTISGTVRKAAVNTLGVEENGERVEVCHSSKKNRPQMFVYP